MKCEIVIESFFGSNPAWTRLDPGDYKRQFAGERSPRICTVFVVKAKTPWGRLWERKLGRFQVATPDGLSLPTLDDLEKLSGIKLQSPEDKDKDAEDWWNS